MAKGFKGKARRRRPKIENTATKNTAVIPTKKYLEKRVKRYVMASVDTGQYLVVIPVKNQYIFTNNIIQATKCRNAFDAKIVIRDYHHDTGDDFDLVVIPLEITYELINETIDSSIANEEYLEDINGRN